MIKRVNSLGRKRVSRDCVAIAVDDGDPRSFTANIDFGEHVWDPNASVVMEATCAGSSLVRRYSCGTVGQLKQPKQLPLSDLHGHNVFFSLKIIDRSEHIGRLLGVAENIKPLTTGKQTVSGRKGILPVERAPLGQELWKLEFRDHDVYLLVNENVPGLSESIRSDPVFFSLIYPQVMRQVLTRAINEGAEPDENDDRWPVLWLAFGRKLHPDHEDPPPPDDTEAAEEWTEIVVQSFCDLHELRSKFVSSGYASGYGDE
ncbi:hypothetical protein Enr13x_57150 [Stieleria neptunia]|uniref:Uncharacterized protein n=1 Tax=Stieleria neptunia TaxID=2527979 RepID=A0A518HY87_9BACT|nr:hypothetical protein [Stieleria neptunia]QDV45812.1 hypothetical protein Enr13x_57150 [Stieleria neptunia]